MVFFGDTQDAAPFAVAFKSWWGRFYFHLKQQYRENFVLIVLCIFAYLALEITMVLIGEGSQRSFIGHMRRALLSITPSVLFGYFVYRLFRLCFFEKPDFILLTLGQDMKRVMLDPRRYARMVPMLLITSFGFIAFVTFKVFIPKIIPFYADTFFMEMDKFLHFGKLPTDWLAPLVEIPAMVRGLDFFYKLWYFIMFGLWGWAAWGASDNGWRRQFVLSFMLCWIIGGALLATLLSSVGPCFYGFAVDGVNPYADHMAALHAIHESKELIAVNLQYVLEQLHFSGNYVVTVGISAMPSLHNTLAVLFAITGYKIHRNIGHILTLYAVIIFIGSVALGWHYAVDGYAGLILAFAMWKFAGWCLHHQDRLSGHSPEDTANKFKFQKFTS